MNKSLYLIAIAGFLSFFVTEAKAQNAYSFSQSQGTYTPLTSKYVVLDTLDPAGMDFVWIVQGFDFQYFGEAYNHVLVNAKGMIFLGDLSSPSVITACVADYDERYDPPTYVSTVSYMVDSVSSQYKILKLEFSNLGFINDDTSNFVNFQAWLYEGTHVIEVHFGDSKTNNADWIGNGEYDGPYIGFDSLNVVNYVLSGNPAAPVFSHDNSLNLDSFPVSGTIYRFSPEWQFPAGVAAKEKPGFILYPNPATEDVHLSTEITGKQAQIRVLDMSGRELLKLDASGQSEIDIPLHSFVNGIYFIELSPDGQLGTQKILKN